MTQEDSKELKKARFRGCNYHLFGPQVAAELYLAETDLKPIDFSVISVLEMHRMKNSDESHPSVRRIARLLNIDRETVRRSLKKLKSFGLTHTSYGSHIVWNMANFWDYISKIPKKPLDQEKKEYLEAQKNLVQIRQELESTRKQLRLKDLALSVETEDRIKLQKELTKISNQADTIVKRSLRDSYKKPDLSLVPDEEPSDEEKYSDINEL